MFLRSATITLELANTGVRGTQNRVIAGYYWSTIIHDVKEWVRSCHRCQVNDPIKTVAPVKEAWEVLGLDLIGPLPETARSNKYVLTMTTLYTKWDERTNQNIKRTLRKYVNDNHNDWDLHLPAVVYGINTAKQANPDRSRRVCSAKCLWNSTQRPPVSQIYPTQTGSRSARGWSASSEPTTGTNPASTGSNSCQEILTRDTALYSLQEAMEKCAKKAFTLTIRPLRLPRQR
ncbi:uncharacterized protein LOC100692678 isoform X1 [Tachysurus ichikawai]